MSKTNSIIDVFTQHKVAANLVMIMMILSGMWAATRINTQLDPSVDWPGLFVIANWPGASAEDIEQLVVVPIEQQLRNVLDLQSMSSSSTNGSARIRLEFNFDADITKALETVTDRVTGIRNLPVEMEPLIIRRGISYEEIATLVLSGGDTVSELIPLARAMERQLYALGIDFIEFDGLPEEEIAIQMSSATLMQLNTTLDEVATQVKQRSANTPAGIVGRSQGEMQLRSLDQRRDTTEFEQMEIAVQSGGGLARLADVAIVERRAKTGQAELMKNGKPAIEIMLRRISNSDAIAIAGRLNEWLETARADLPDGVELHIYQEVWVLLKEQLSVIVENGSSGLILVVLMLFLFLSGRVGWWVMIGIPVSFLFATLLYYTLFDGSINILALITFIMALGIVVDDAIVVGEDSVSLFEQGYSPAEAAAGGAKRMFMPVLTSSLTTLAAFVPLIIAGGEMGAVIQTMPIVLLCVIVASLIECFLVLPGHLKKSFEKINRDNPGRFRSAFDRKFFHLREKIYRPVLEKALAFPGVTLWTAFGFVILAISLVISGRVGVNMVMGMSLEMLEANVAFTSEASPERRQAFMSMLEQTLDETNAEFNGDNINGFISKSNSAMLDQERKSGSQYSSMRIEYAWEDAYSVPPQQFINSWREKIVQPPWVEQVLLEVRGGANGGAPDMSLILKGQNLVDLKNASEELQAALAGYEGVSNIYDNLPYGKDQIIFSLTPTGIALGVSTSSLGQQLRAAYNGARVQIFNQNNTELEVLVTLPDVERDHISSLYQLPVKTAAGDLVPLGLIATLNNRRGIDIINRNGGYLAITVSASVDSNQNNAERILGQISSNELALIKQKYGLSSDLAGMSLQSQQILETMKLGGMLTLVFIYLILCWSFSSYLWPLAVLTAIPLGLTGAIAGHWFMGVDIGVMSLLAFFALTGVVVNDSIVLVSFFRRELQSGKTIKDAIQSAALSRFRAVLLTSLTTVAGLAPLMFENFSLALYMVPVAITLCFGLAFATLLVLLLIPALILMIENSREKLKSLTAVVTARAYLAK